MMHKRFFTISILCAGVTLLFGFAGIDDGPLAKIRQQLDKWASERPIEKVYLHFDKPYYAAGEDIWFKAYVVDDINQPSTISGIVNVELLDERDSVRQSIKLSLAYGAAHGDMALPDTMHAGNYHIRAYTNYMRNAGSNYFFAKTVAIVNPLMSGGSSSAKIAEANRPAGKIDVQFFPEGGYLVNGIATKLAFKAVAPNGLGAGVTGVVTDNKGQQVAKFSSTHLGMGAFELTPKYGVSYQAKIIAANGGVQTIQLPQVAEKGYVLSIADNDEESLQVKISTEPASSSQQLTLVAQNAGKIYYAATSKPGPAVFTAVIPKSKFPSGIVQFTLFSASGEPLNERLVFIQRPDQLNLTTTTDKPMYAPREKVKLMLNAQSADQKPIAGNFSVSVIDENRVPVDEANENNIMANLLLTSDLGGYVEQPAWYFNKPDSSTQAALDVLMLTQGYRRFEWKQVLNDVLPAMQYKPENSLHVAGVVLTPGGRPVANAKVKLYDLDSIAYNLDAVTDDNGRFDFKDLTFNDSVRFIVQARTIKGKSGVDIKMDPIRPTIAPGRKGFSGYDITVDSSLSVYARNSKRLYAEQRKFGLGNHVVSLQEVVIRERRQLLKNSSNLNGPGNADQVIQGKDLQLLSCARIADCLQGRLLGVTFINGVPMSTRDNRPVQVIVDGMYVEGDFLNTINFSDVVGIEMLRNGGLTAIYGGRGGGGVLLITTKRGDEGYSPAAIYTRGITTYYPKSYYKSRTFYSPQYDQPKVNKQLADLRTTIYWNPDVIAGNDGKASFAYFNAGSPGTYRVVVEGIAADGEIGRSVYRYKVQ